MRVTKELVLTPLPLGTIFYHQEQRNADGSPLRARINGKARTKRRDLTFFELPMKYGFKQCFYLNATTLDEWFTTEEEAMLFHEDREIVQLPGGSWAIIFAGSRSLASMGLFETHGEALEYAKEQYLPKGKKGRAR